MKGRWPAAALFSTILCCFAHQALAKKPSAHALAGAYLLTRVDWDQPLYKVNLFALLLQEEPSGLVAYHGTNDGDALAFAGPGYPVEIGADSFVHQYGAFKMRLHPDGEDLVGEGELAAGNGVVELHLKRQHAAVVRKPGQDTLVSKVEDRVARNASAGAAADDNDAVAQGLQFVAVGSTGDPSAPYACTWDQQGRKTALAKPWSAAQDVVRNGERVVIAGYQNSYPRLRGTLWADDGKMLFQETRYSDIARLFVVDRTTYAVGMVKEQAAFWENGKLTVIPSKDAQATGLARIGKKLYVAGRVNGPTDSIATIWEDGHVIFAGPKGSEIKALTTRDGVLYAAGELLSVQHFAHIQAVYWRNGELVTLQSPFLGTFVSDIRVVSGRVVVSGYTLSNGPCIWVDGVFQSIDQQYGVLEHLDEWQGRIVASGWVQAGPKRDGNYRAFVWVEGRNRIELGPGKASSIMVH